ncbi:BREX system Lon protease-like protein BrxL [uncultured Rubinisphaera sp.]|uniref:BREX system Lon protease-like protein BrxL n=1 Tax=uncultured Rubinisphaera sp. TaxID=1678686 RepID=UPI0030D75B07
MKPLDKKITEHFAGLVVRKDLVKAVKGNAIVPSYVLEYLLGQYCATSDEESIQTGIQTVKEILAKHYVHRSESGLVRSQIREKKLRKIIDRVSVDLNDKEDVYQATFANLGINKVAVPASTVKKHQKLLTGGVWCIADIEYQHNEDEKSVPWILESLKPIQLSSFDFDGYLDARKRFTTDEWIDTLIQSIGFNPEAFGKRSKLLQLIRLIPFCERNYNLIELGPKGTGKSHVYSEFSPHGMLISGGEVTVPKLFVENRAPYKIGLVGYWDCVAFDEFAGKSKRVDKALVDIMKNYMANKSFSRGIETLGAEASMAFVGNTQHTVAHMLRHSDLFDELPPKYHDSAFLDRIHFFIPGWEIDIIRGDMFTADFGFVVDYFAEILKQQRNFDYSHLYTPHFQLSEQISTRDRDAINKTFSGLVKIIFPNQDATEEELEELLAFAIEGRKRVKDQLMRIDQTYADVRFAYVRPDGKELLIKTLEEDTYPTIYHKSGDPSDEPIETTAKSTDVSAAMSKPAGSPEEGHVTVKENQRGVDFDTLFGPYVQGASKIVLTDPYIRMFHQARNLMEFIETVDKVKSDDQRVEVELITSEEEFSPEKQLEFFEQIQKNCLPSGILFSWGFETGIHARHIVTDTGWKVLLDRGLDVFQKYEMNDTFTLANRLQKHRACKAFEVTYLRQ